MIPCFKHTQMTHFAFHPSSTAEMAREAKPRDNQIKLYADKNQRGKFRFQFLQFFSCPALSFSSLQKRIEIRDKN